MENRKVIFVDLLFTSIRLALALLQTQRHQQQWSTNRDAVILPFLFSAGLFAITTSIWGFTIMFFAMS